MTTAALPMPTTWLDLVCLAPAAVLVVRFLLTGGMPMLRMMGGSPERTHS